MAAVWLVSVFSGKSTGYLRGKPYVDPGNRAAFLPEGEIQNKYRLITVIYKAEVSEWQPVSKW
jgi:hypothetical protein